VFLFGEGGEGKREGKREGRRGNGERRDGIGERKGLNPLPFPNPLSSLPSLPPSSPH